jgi:transposase
LRLRIPSDTDVMPIAIPMSCRSPAAGPAAAGLPRALLRRGGKTAVPDFVAMRRELQTHKHLTLQLLWQEYRQQQPEGYGYGRYCGLSRAAL